MSWYDDEELAERRVGHNAFLQAKTEEAWREFRRLRDKCARLITQKKQEDWDKLMQQIQEAYTNSHRQLWRLVRLAPSGKKAEFQPMRGKTGKLAKSEEQIMEVWTKHLESLGTQEARPLPIREAGKYTKRTLRAPVPPTPAGRGVGGPL